MKSCPRCRAELVDHWHGGRCSESTCPSIGEPLLLCIRDFMACGWTGCPGILAQYAVGRAQLLHVLRARMHPEATSHCTLCTCNAVYTAHGFPVCSYHQTHGEDDPACPVCAQPDPARRPRRRRLTRRSLGGLLLAHGRQVGLSIDLVYVRERLRRWAAFDALAKRASLVWRPRRVLSEGRA